MVYSSTNAGRQMIEPEKVRGKDTLGVVKKNEPAPVYGMRRLAIGPACDWPSWRWVGVDTSKELAKYFDVALFDSFKRIPPCDAVLVVKHRPPLQVVKILRENGVKVIFAPIDVYESQVAIHCDRAFLESCDLVLSHSEPLLKHLRPYCTRIALVEHHGKYTLPVMASYKHDGYVLWIGALQHAPHLLDWLTRHPVRWEVKMLTNLSSPAAVSAARNQARRLGLGLEIGSHSINGYGARAWSETEQLRMMQECKAAIDVKGGDFHALTKPPTKAQKFVSSGIPFACNSESSASGYFRERGFELCSPLDEDRWFSRDYWKQICSLAGNLRERISIEAVGLCYRTELQSLWDAESP